MKYKTYENQNNFSSKRNILRINARGHNRNWWWCFKPIGKINLNSLNFDKDKVWLKIIEGAVEDPYKSLPKVFDDWDDDFETISELDDINNGGAALTAYGKIQYTDMSHDERLKIKDALLRYCELDTLAMVIIFEHLKELTEK